ncbi:WD40 repeat-like protein [Auriscalpium vulgare]|uniref:WD40 repeat-like protein n=1 Tax=Auriscalpium vulgare TaxID=40419 RepID=A0ACB8SBN7_9AGAM|nr:WD40 repeat-like protein [Auriscalpium vulgare]
MSGSRSKLKTAFKKARTIGPLYTGGAVAITADGKWLVTCVAEDVVLTDIAEGAEICRFVSDKEPVTALCITPSGKQLAVYTSSTALRIYDLPTSSAPLSRLVHPARTIPRAHEAPVHVCKADPTSTYLASGAADGTVKVFDLARGFATHVLRGHGGVVSALAWSFPRGPSLGLEERALRLITASVDTRVRVWDLVRGAETARKGKTVKPDAVLEGHVSVPRGLDVTEDGRYLISGGRDSVVLVWDMEGAGKGGKKGKGKEREEVPVLVNTVTVLERVEAAGLLREHEEVAGTSGIAGRLRFWTAGEKGVVRVWDGKRGSVICTLGEEQEASSADQEEQRQILDAIYVPSTSTIISVHADQNILFHSLRTQSLSRQLIGFNDEIIDAAFLRSPSAEHESHIALATNSSLIRLYSTHSLDARLLTGHTDIVLCLAASSSGSVFASGGKDKAVRLWAPVAPAAGDAWGWACVAICEGHAESVGAVAFSRQDGPAGALKFLFTGSQDRTIKMWDIASVPGSASDAALARCKSLSTTKAHDKDINALDVAPNDALLASGSQDKSAKVWAIDARGAFTLRGTCRGHKRGVWSVRFARGERILATGSGDRTVRLWGLEDFACLKVLEGHGNSVLRVDWMGGTGEGGGSGQVVSASADGLVKVWDVGSQECVATLDGHEDKVWALSVSRDSQTIVSGAADSVVTIWEDCTEEQEAEKEAARTEIVLKEQDFQNYLALNDYQRAISLALSLSHPGRLYKLFHDLAAAPAPGASITGHPAVDEVVRTLAAPDLAQLLRYVRTWNARAGTAGVAQRVLNAIVRLRPSEDVVRAFDGPPGSFNEEGESGGKKGRPGEGNVRELVEALIPYTERHLARMERLVQESYVVDYVLGEMDGLLGDEGEDGMDVELIAHQGRSM